MAFAQDTFQGLPVVNLVVNGKAVTSDVPAVILAGRTVLPVRTVAEALGLNVKWDPDTSTVTLSSKAPAPKDAVYSDQYVSVSNVKVNKNSFGTTVLMEVTNVNAQTVSGILSVTFYDSTGAIMGTASGAVNELAPGATKTAQLIGTQDFSGYASYKVQADAMFTK